MLILLATIYYIIQNKAWSLAPEKTKPRVVRLCEITE